MANHDDYDGFALAYSEDNETNAWNAYCERPASLRLAGGVAGLRVLDAGCGSGANASELIARGATVVGIEKSAGLLAIARERLGLDVRLEKTGLNEPLPFDDQSFDLVLASLFMQEDAIVLAKCLRDLPDTRQAFKAYERLRRGRVREGGENAAHLGQNDCSHAKSRECRFQPVQSTYNRLVATFRNAPKTKANTIAAGGRLMKKRRTKRHFRSASRPGPGRPAR